MSHVIICPGMFRVRNIRRLLLFGWGTEQLDVVKSWKWMERKLLCRLHFTKQKSCLQFSLDIDPLEFLILLPALSFLVFFFFSLLHQVFEGTSGIDSKHTTVQFTGEVYKFLIVMFLAFNLGSGLCHVVNWVGGILWVAAGILDVVWKVNIEEHLCLCACLIIMFCFLGSFTRMKEKA